MRKVFLILVIFHGVLIADSQRVVEGSTGNAENKVNKHLITISTNPHKVLSDTSKLLSKKAGLKPVVTSDIISGLLVLLLILLCILNIAMVISWFIVYFFKACYNFASHKNVEGNEMDLKATVDRE